jgi:hypothetical protein
MCVMCGRVLPTGVFAAGNHVYVERAGSAELHPDSWAAEVKRAAELTSHMLSHHQLGPLFAHCYCQTPAHFGVRHIQQALANSL